MNKIILYLAAMLVILLVKPAMSQTDLNQSVPVDPEVRKGVLENGITYYIRHNEEPKERASFYIFQNVGALLEEDNQNGLAHFLEHMAFNGTEHFEGKGILNTLEKHGVAFGRNINAYTAYNETVYNLSDVPSNVDGLVDTCLLILHDWTDFLLLTDEEIDSERGVITEEWRTRRNSGYRLRDQYFPVLLKGSKWAERDIIGDTTVIKYHKPATLKKFYHDWYRTDLQGIAIVGDVDVDAVEASIKSIFADVEPIENPKKRKKFEIPDHEDTYFVLATDKEATQSIINMYSLAKNKDGEEKTLNDYRIEYINSLFNTMLQNRIQELLQKGTPPFVNGYIQYGGFLRGYSTTVIGTTANPNEEGKALEAIYTEAYRAKVHGFTEGELERAKINLLTSIESAYKQRDKIRNDSYARQYKDNFLTKEPIPSMEFEFEFANEVIPTISVAEVSAKAAEWINGMNRTLVITGPDKDVEHLTEAEAFEILNKVENSAIEPYVDEAASQALIEGELPGGKIVSTKQITELGAVQWTLDNGATVIFRKADYEKDNVALRSYSAGGKSQYKVDELPSAEMVGTFVNAYGIGDFNSIALTKMLTGKKVSVSPGLGELTEGINGSSTPKDFETLMQLLYLYFEHPRFDEEAHNALLARYKAYVTNVEKDPAKILNDSLSNILTNYSSRNTVFNSAYVNNIDFNKIKDIYNDRYQDASDFTFIIVGNIDEETVKPMVEKYIGSMTDIDRKEAWVDHPMSMAKGGVVKKIEIPFTTPKTNVNVVYESDMKYKRENELLMSVLKGILSLRYTETVREEEGGTYGVRVRGSVSQLPSPESSISMSFDCDPEKAEKLKSIIYREIDKLVAEGPSKVDFDKTVKNLLKDREQSKEHNSFWMNSLYNYKFYGLNTASEDAYENILREMTQKDVQKYLKKFLKSADTADIQFVPAQ